MSIRIYYGHIKFRIRKAKEIKRFLDKVIRDEGRFPGDLLFILTDDESVLNINKEFLKSDHYTDVIAFDNSVGYVVNGEIYISVDTVRRNSEKFGYSVIVETLRVMIHGVLHLCGYDDTKAGDRNKMFLKQEILVEQIRSILQ